MATSAEEAALLFSLRDGSSNNTSPVEREDDTIVDAIVKTHIENNRTALSSSSPDDDKLLQASSTPALPPLEGSPAGAPADNTTKVAPDPVKRQRPKDPRNVRVCIVLLCEFVCSII